ncbi:class I SAM-dependent methyltransferase [Saccharothrix sp.]|uniref:class I SAM-dependent methyltransferase n=1 Tax=Saccharothrix sp. TaxID=1873460 RepID=UPI002810AE5A|nr:class I SAM-dependent methyltransferase [Saccharothrix sp.]
MHAATLGRSVKLFRAFRNEQTDRDTFYRTLAEDSANQVESFTSLAGKLLLDVGGGPGYFSEAFRGKGARYVGLDPDVGELSARGAPGQDMVRASGTNLPVRTGSVDVCYSSNVLEHVSEPHAMLAEMVRVTKPGGTVFLSFTPWLSPWGGHETSPWHYLGGDFAARRFAAKNGAEPKNRFGVSLFAFSFGAALGWLRGREDAVLVRAFPRYHPSWAAWVAHVPGLREVASWNAVLVMRRL